MTTGGAITLEAAKRGYTDVLTDITERGITIFPPDVRSMPVATQRWILLNMEKLSDNFYARISYFNLELITELLNTHEHDRVYRSWLVEGIPFALLVGNPDREEWLSYLFPDNAEHKQFLLSVLTDTELTNFLVATKLRGHEVTLARNSINCGIYAYGSMGHIQRLGATPERGSARSMTTTYSKQMQ